VGFKADTSFLRFLSMGAAGARQTIEHLRSVGFQPIELERYCTSNKIWATKVKRLRLPDLLCVRTGLRLEVRAKSDLKIRMSDAPANVDRRWDSGLRDDDVAAFIACGEENGAPAPAKEAVFFTIGDLRESVDTSQLGPPKSASEGAERDRTWPSVVPSRNGRVEEVAGEVLRVVMDLDEEGRPRRQSYQLRGKIAYVQAGDRFVGSATFLAGTPRRRARLEDYLRHRYQPLENLAAASEVDRYAAVKSLPFRADLHHEAIGAIDHRLDVESDARVLLEAAGAGTALGSAKARERLESLLWHGERGDLRMEAVLILTELRAPGAHEILSAVITSPNFAYEEIRQAAVWGLGKAGLQRYDDLVPFIGDPDRDVALHAIAGFGENTPADVIDRLIVVLISGDPERAPAASEALRIIGTDLVLGWLLDAQRSTNQSDAWILATLGRLPVMMVRAALHGNALLSRLEPLLLLSESSNWLADSTVDIDIKFLLKQNFIAER
jgi:hypothetical protein